MCIFYDGIRAARTEGAAIESIYALAALPGFKKTTFLNYYLLEEVPPVTPVIELLKALARAAFYGELHADLQKLPEEQGFGEQALTVLGQKLQDTFTGELPADTTITLKSIYHQMLEVQGLTKELTLAIIALNSRRIRKSCLNWHAKNPGSGKSWQILLLDKLALAVEDDALIDNLEVLPVNEHGGSEGVNLIRKALSQTTRIGLAITDDAPKKPCCAS